MRRKGRPTSKSREITRTPAEISTSANIHAARNRSTTSISSSTSQNLKDPRTTLVTRLLMAITTETDHILQMIKDTVISSTISNLEMTTRLKKEKQSGWPQTKGLQPLQSLLHQPRKANGARAISVICRPKCKATTTGTRQSTSRKEGLGAITTKTATNAIRRRTTF